MKMVVFLAFLVSSMSYAGETIIVSPVANSEKNTDLLANIRAAVAKAPVEKEMPSSATEQIIKIFPTLSIGDWVSGDLNQDGIQDIAVFISGAVGRKDEEHSIIVLKGKANGDYELMSQSLSWGFGYSNYSDGMEIKNGSLVFSMHITERCCEYNDAFQFKLKEGSLVLIGYDSHHLLNIPYEDWDEKAASTIHEKADENYNQYGQSINFLTNRKMQWMRDSKLFRHSKGYKETASKIVPKPLLKLEQFDLDNYTDYFDKNTFNNIYGD